MYVIWSNEHKSWWAPNSNGYVQKIEQAGIYSRDEAVAIVEGATFGDWSKSKVPNELAVRVEDLPEEAKVRLGQV